MIRFDAPWLIFGATGRLGRALQNRLAVEGVQFLSIGRDQLDLSSPINFDSVARRLGWPKFGTLVNCAGFTDVDGAELEPALATRLNVDFVAELAEFARHTETRLIQISTNYVFDGRLARPYLTTDTPAPLQQYGISKLGGEHAVRAAVDQGARAAIVRTVWLYGSHPTNPTLPDRLARRLLAGEPVYLHRQLGVPTWAADVAEYLVRLAELPDSEFVGVHHALASGSVSWHDFGMQIAQDLGVNPELVNLREVSEVGGAVRPVNGLLEPTAVGGFAIENWLSAWQRYLPEFLEGLGRSGRAR